MPAKITLTGKRVSPIITTLKYYRFDMLEKGSPSAPKGLPLASPVLYTVFIGLKPGRVLDILNLPEDQSFLIMGEITMELSKELCPGQVGVISFNAQLLDHKEKKAQVPGQLGDSPIPDKEIQKVVTAGHEILKPGKVLGNTTPFYDDNRLREEVHLFYSGKCTACSAKMDKGVARIKLIDQSLPPELNNLLLICPDCNKNRKNPALTGLSIAPKAMLKFDKLGMDQNLIDNFLSGFINKFVLVEIVESQNFREYWVPDKQYHILKFKVVNNMITDLKIVVNRIP